MSLMNTIYLSQRRPPKTSWTVCSYPQTIYDHTVVRSPYYFFTMQYHYCQITHYSPILGYHELYTTVYSRVISTSYILCICWMNGIFGESSQTSLSSSSNTISLINIIQKLVNKNITQ